MAATEVDSGKQLLQRERMDRPQLRSIFRPLSATTHSSLQISKRPMSASHFRAIFPVNDFNRQSSVSLVIRSQLAAVDDENTKTFNQRPASASAVKHDPYSRPVSALDVVDNKVIESPRKNETISSNISGTVSGVTGLPPTGKTRPTMPPFHQDFTINAFLRRQGARRDERPSSATPVERPHSASLQRSHLGHRPPTGDIFAQPIVITQNSMAGTLKSTPSYNTPIRPSTPGPAPRIVELSASVRSTGDDKCAPKMPPNEDRSSVSRPIPFWDSVGNLSPAPTMENSLTSRPDTPQEGVRMPVTGTRTGTAYYRKSVKSEQLIYCPRPKADGAVEIKVVEERPGQDSPLSIYQQVKREVELHRQNRVGKQMDSKPAYIKANGVGKSQNSVSINMINSTVKPGESQGKTSNATVTPMDPSSYQPRVSIVANVQVNGAIRPDDQQERTLNSTPNSNAGEKALPNPLALIPNKVKIRSTLSVTTPNGETISSEESGQSNDMYSGLRPIRPMSAVASVTHSTYKKEEDAVDDVVFSTLEERQPGDGESEVTILDNSRGPDGSNHKKTNSTSNSPESPQKITRRRRGSSGSRNTEVKPTPRRRGSYSKRSGDVSTEDGEPDRRNRRRSSSSHQERSLSRASSCVGLETEEAEADTTVENSSDSDDEKRSEVSDDEFPRRGIRKRPSSSMSYRRRSVETRESDNRRGSFTRNRAKSASSVRRTSASYEFRTNRRLPDAEPAFIYSLFNNVPPVVNFVEEGERVEPLPKEFHKYLRWRMSSITPVVVKNTIFRSGFKASRLSSPSEEMEGSETPDWIGYFGRHMRAAVFKSIREYQKVNHFPGSYQLGRKDRLWINLHRMQGQYGRREFSFLPHTYNMPADFKEFKTYWDEHGGHKEKWILKPPASARGNGIRVVHKWNQIPKKRAVVVQRYISNPYLINDSKFDLRVYVYVSSFDPLRIYVHEDGLVRFASQKYSSSVTTLNNRYVHLTNYSVNRYNSEYVANGDRSACHGHKWSLKALWSYFRRIGVNPDVVWDKMKDMIVKTIISVEAHIAANVEQNCRRRYCAHELFGFDILLDDDLKPWILEVNISPSLHSNSELDNKVKGAMIKDMLNLAGYQMPDRGDIPGTGPPPNRSGDYEPSSPLVTDRRLWDPPPSVDELKKQNFFVHLCAGDHRMELGILNPLTPGDVRCLLETLDETNRAGGFEVAFPTAMAGHKYLRFFEKPKYNNLLVCAFYHRYVKAMNKGIDLIRKLCRRKVHLQGEFSQGLPVHPSHVWSVQRPGEQEEEEDTPRENRNTGSDM